MPNCIFFALLLQFGMGGGGLAGAEPLVGQSLV